MSQSNPLNRALRLLLLAGFVVALSGAAQAANFVTKAVQAAGANWTAAIWSNPPNAVATAPAAGNTYQAIANGTAIANGANNTRVRNVASDGLQTFPGDSLTLDANTELRAKKGPTTPNNTIINFPGVGGNPGLILNGGMINDGDDAVFIITGKVSVVAASVIDPGNPGAGALAPARQFTIAASLQGSGSLTLQTAATNLPLDIQSVANTYSGDWNISSGYLKGSGNGSLGSGNITIGATNSFGGAPPVANGTKFEVNYDISQTTGRLTLRNGGVMLLHQNCTFRGVTVNTTALSAGVNSYASLNGTFPATFPAGGSGSITIPGPTGLSAIVTGTQIALSWSASAGATNYVVQRSTTSGGPYTRIATNAATGFTDTGLSAGLTYFYVVLAQDGIGETANSPQASGTITPAAPATITAAPGDMHATVTWSAAIGATSYIVKRSGVMGGPYTPIRTNATTSYIDNGLVNLTPYFYVVSAVNAGGESPDSSEATATPNVAPSALIAVGGTNQVSLSWTALGGAVSYFVKRSTSSGGPYANIATGVGPTSYLDTTAAIGTTYYYVVSADLGGSESAYADEAAATTAPSTPGSVAALAVTGLTQGGRQINVSWITNNEVVTSIQIERSTNGVDFALVGTVGGAAQTFSNASLATLTTYQYRIRALNGTGSSSYSVVVSATTTVNINFQIPTTVTPLGYLADTGIVFSVQQAGYSYGWDVDNGPNARERASTLSPDKRYDTFTHLQKQVPARAWEIAIPNGTYSVHMVSGDPTATDSAFRLNLEGALSMSGVPNNPNFWVESTSTVTVADGRLSLTVDPAAAGNTANNAKINFIDIAPVSAVAPSISSQPQSVTTIQGANTNFNVTTAGTLPQTYQWRRAGVNIAGGANSGSIVGNNALSLAGLRVADAGNYDVVICNSAGCITSSVVTLTFLQDFGDAPDTYKTTLANNGARHFILTGLNLGASVDAELDGFPSVGADGDDLNNTDDEDGVTFTGPVLLGQTINVTVVSSAVGKLDAWMDFGANGTFDPTDQIFTSQPLVAGPNLLTFNVPASAVLGNTYARFRLSSAGGLGPDGPANDGEVEDYAVTILPASDLAIGKIGLPQMVDVNGGVTYTLSITNIGPSDATGVTVIDTLPASVILGSALSSQGSCVPSGNTINCNLGGLVSGATASVTITVTTTSGGSITNLAVVSADQIDPRPANNTARAVNAVDRPPVAGNDTMGAISNRTATVLTAKLLSNDTDPDGDTLTLSAVSATSTNGGTVSLGAGSVTYAPAANYVGADAFTYTVSDGRGGSATGTVLVTVRSATDPSLNIIGGVTTNQNGALIQFAGIPGRTYTVERSVDLSTWTAIGTATVPAHGITSFQDTSPPPGGGFYRTVYP